MASTDESPPQTGLMIITNFWESVRIQLTATNQVIAMPNEIFDSFSRDDMQYLVDAFEATVHHQGMFARDGSMNRVFLGPTNHFVNLTLIHLDNKIPILIHNVPAKPALASKPVGSRLKDKIPRPSNAFILYRKSQHATIVSANPGVHNNKISVIIGAMWRKETLAVRAKFGAKAEELKKEHHRKYPGYRFQPRKPSERKRRVSKKMKLDTASHQAASRYPRLSRELEDNLETNLNENGDVECHTVTFPLSDEAEVSLIDLQTQTAINDGSALGTVANNAPDADEVISTLQPSAHYAAAQTADQFVFHFPDVSLNNIGNENFETFFEDLTDGYNNSIQDDYNFSQANTNEIFSYFNVGA